MAWFGAFRNHYGFAHYGDNRTPVTVDFPTVAVAYLCVLLAVATLISTLGIRGRERWATTLRALYAVGIGSIILVCLVGHDWLVGSTEVQSHYLYRSNNDFRGTVGLRIALHSCNITLEGTYNQPQGRGHVYYAESMHWTDYGKEQEMISYYLERGLPHPILTVMDFLSVDAGGLRWGRNFHSAGYFGCALLWTAFVFWVISNVLLMSVICYGAFMFFLTGVAMVLTCIVYHVCQPPLALRIEFGPNVLTTTYGWCFWLCLISGIVTLVLGGLLFLLDHLFPEKMSEFFNLENLDQNDLPEIANSSSSLASKDKLSSANLQFHPGHTRHGSLQQINGSGRRVSLQPNQPGQRKGSIFLEPERRGEFSNGVRRGSFFAGYSASSASLGIANKGFEQERSKSNPLFSGSSAADIQEESGEEAVEVRIDVGGEELVTSGGGGGKYYDNRKPSLATMREHRENHMNERQQLQSSSSSSHHPSYIVNSASDSVLNSTPIPTFVVVHCPSDEEGKEDDVRKGDDVRVRMTEEGTMTGTAYDCTNDSAFASGNASPAESEQNSTCDDVEVNRM